MDRWLVYGTVGDAFSKSTQHQGAFFLGAKDIDGLAYGGGVEWAFAPSWSAKIEYLRLDFGHPNIFSPLNVINVRNDMRDMNVVRIGLNYKFGDPGWGKGPVSAKY